MSTQINLNPDLKERVKEHGKKTGMSMTTIFHLALERYFDNMVISEKMRDIFLKALEHEKNSITKT